MIILEWPLPFFIFKDHHSVILICYWWHVAWHLQVDIGCFTQVSESWPSTKALLKKKHNVWFCGERIKYLGPVVQSIVSLTSSLRVIMLTVLADSIYNILIFFAEKMWVAIALQKLLTFFQQKIQHICVSLHVNFNESLTNDIVSFEQLGPVLFRELLIRYFF